MQARDAMTTSVATIRQEATVREAEKLMLQRRVSALPVLGPKDRLSGSSARAIWCAGRSSAPTTGALVVAADARVHRRECRRGLREDAQHTGKRCNDQS